MSPVPRPPPKARALCPHVPAPAPAPPPHTHWTVGTGEPEAWQGRSRGCPTRVVTWPKPSATRSCGGTAGRTPPTVRRLELSKPHPKALPSLQYPQSKAQASPYPSSSPINGASSKRPSRTTQGQVASAWPCPVYSVSVSPSDSGFRSPACLVPCLISNTTWATPESMPERCPSSGRK